MSIKSDNWIIQAAQKRELISPFVKSQIKKGNISFGPSSYGYDIRLSEEFKLFSPAQDSIIDPKAVQEGLFRQIKAGICTLCANSFVLGRSLEYFKMPDNLLGIVTGKSTYARCGIIVNVTPLEPGWQGFLTISISNTAPRPVRLYAGEGIAQVLFFEASEPCKISYRDKGGKYQGQKDVTIAKM